MSFDLENKRILITGATDGLGRETALILAKLGSKIIVHGRNEKKAKKVVAELKEINSSGEYSILICDLIHTENIESAFSTIKELDILINNAGVWTEGDTVDASIEKIVELTNVNLTASMAIARLMIPVLLESEFGQILNVVSIAGVEIPSDYYHSIYSGTKFGLQGFTESLVKEFDNRNLRVMAIYPAGMNTGLFEKAGIHYEPNEPWMFDPKESAEAMVFMLTRNPNVNVKRLDLINN